MIILKSKPRHLDLKEEAVYFITTHTIDFLPVFKNEKLVRIFFDKFSEYQKLLKLQIYGYNLLLNHLHFITKAKSKDHLSYILFRLKGGTSRAINQFLEKRGNLWQDHYYDQRRSSFSDSENRRPREEQSRGNSRGNSAWEYCGTAKSGEQAARFSSQNGRRSPRIGIRNRD